MKLHFLMKTQMFMSLVNVAKFFQNGFAYSERQLFSHIFCANEVVLQVLYLKSSQKNQLLVLWRFLFCWKGIIFQASGGWQLQQV